MQEKYFHFLVHICKVQSQTQAIVHRMFVAFSKVLPLHCPKVLSCVVPIHTEALPK